MQQAQSVGNAVYNSAPVAMSGPIMRATSRKFKQKTLVQKVDEIRHELGISADVSLADVVKQAHADLGLTPSGIMQQQVATIFATLGLTDGPAEAAPTVEVTARRLADAPVDAPVVHGTIVVADSLGLPSAPVSQMEVTVLPTPPPAAPAAPSTPPTPPPAAPTVIAASGRRAEMVRASDMPSWQSPFWDRPQYAWSNQGTTAFLSMEAHGAGAKAYFLKVCNDDKPTKADVAQYTISTSQPMRVYLDFWGGEKHASMGFARWQDGWTKSSNSGTSFHQPGGATWGPGVVYYRDFKPGTIVLKGNQGEEVNHHGTYYAFLLPNPPNFDPDRKPPPKKPEPRFTDAGNNGLWSLVDVATNCTADEEAAAAAISAARQANPNYSKPDKKDECGGLCGIILLSGCYVLCWPQIIQARNGLNFYVRYLPAYGFCVYGFLVTVRLMPHPFVGFRTDYMMPVFAYFLGVVAFTWTAYIMMYNREKPLHNAAQSGRSKLVKALLGKGADVNGRTHFNTTALHVAAANGYDGTVKVLIDAGADVNAKHGCCECTPIECAFVCCAFHVVGRLLRKGAKWCRPLFCLFLTALVMALPLIVVFFDCRKVNFEAARMQAQGELPFLSTARGARGALDWPENNPVPAESLCERLGLAISPYANITELPKFKGQNGHLNF